MMILMSALDDIVIKASPTNFGMVNEQEILSVAELGEIVRKASLTEWFINPVKGQPRYMDIYRVRAYARCEWVSLVVNYLINRVKVIDYELVARDPTKRDAPSGRIQAEITRVENFLEGCTSDGKSFKQIVEPALVRDVLELDSGVLVKYFTRDSYVGDPMKPNSLKPLGSRKLAELASVDGGTFLKDIDQSLILHAYWQYQYRRPLAHPVFFDPAEISYIMRYPRSYSPYGWSVLQNADAVLNSLINSAAWNANFFSNQAVPKGMITLDGEDEDIKRFRTWWKSRIEGKWHNIPVVPGQNVKWVPFGMTAADMEWLSGQKWYQRLICAFYQVQPAEVGMEDTSRTTGAVMNARDSIQTTASVEPILRLIENALNTEIIPEISPRVILRYAPKDTATDKAEAEIEAQQLEQGLVTINELRVKKSQLPVMWGDMPLSLVNNYIRSYSRFGIIPPIKDLGKEIAIPKPEPKNTGDGKEDKEEPEEENA